MRGHQEQQSRLIYELCALVLSILRSPHLPVPSPLPPVPAGPRRAPQVTPAGLASLLLGVSLAMMLCGWVTFVIGFMLMPWVLGLVMVFYFVGIVSNLSVLGRSILCPGSVRSTRKDVSGQFFSKLPII